MLWLYLSGKTPLYFWLHTLNNTYAIIYRIVDKIMLYFLFTLNLSSANLSDILFGERNFHSLKLSQQGGSGKDHQHSLIQHYSLLTLMWGKNLYHYCYYYFYHLYHNHYFTTLRLPLWGSYSFNAVLHAEEGEMMDSFWLRRTLTRLYSAPLYPLKKIHNHQKWLLTHSISTKMQDSSNTQL